MDLSDPWPDFDDAAALRVIPAHPALSDAAARDCLGGIAKLFAQFEREATVHRFAAGSLCDGALLLIAWEADEALSGCRKDRLARLLAEHERRSGSELLAPPPVVLDRDGRPVCTTLGAFKSQLAVGALDSSSLAWNHLAETLGEWRRGPRRPVADLPFLARTVALATGG